MPLLRVIADTAKTRPNACPDRNIKRGFPWVFAYPLGCSGSRRPGAQRTSLPFYRTQTLTLKRYGPPPKTRHDYDNES